MRPKSYINLNCKNIIKEMIAIMPPIAPLEEIDIIKTELELLGYIRYKTDNKLDRHRVFIMEIIDNQIANPKLKIYSLGTGNIAQLKIQRKLLKFKEHQIITISKLIQKYKYYYKGEIDGTPQFERSNIEKEWWIEKCIL